MNNELGFRMKEQYENRTRTFLPRRTYTIIRIDGKAFHTLTKVEACKKPFDDKLMNAMSVASKFVCENVMGAKFGYAQGDECSILLTDFAKKGTESWFNGNIQKVCSVVASMFTAKFNDIYKPSMLAFFDARVFTIPDPIEVENYFIWRQKDAERNSINAVAQSYYSHKELMGKSCKDMQELIHQKGDNWNNYKTKEKRGVFIDRGIVEGYWNINVEPPIFTKDIEFLRSRIPRWEYKE